MGRKLYVGNLTYGVTASDLEKLFEPFGTVQSAQVIMDRDTGRSKGFGFVEMGTDQEAQAAIAGLHDKESDGRRLHLPLQAGRPPDRPLQAAGKGFRSAGRTPHRGAGPSWRGWPPPAGRCPRSKPAAGSRSARAPPGSRQPPR